MRYARALPTNQLMPAVGSRNPPAATLRWVDAPKRMSGRTLRQPARPGTPSIIMSPDDCPWTQIRLCAGTHDAFSRTNVLSQGRQQMS